jgi:hypothetical protein
MNRFIVTIEYRHATPLRLDLPSSYDAQRAVSEALKGGAKSAKIEKVRLPNTSRHRLLAAQRAIYGL